MSQTDHAARARLLYVEDDPQLGFVTRDNLELQGYEVVWVQDGEAALEAFAKQSFDLCILDVMLPRVDGFTLAETIREQDQDVPILFLTARSLKEDRIQGLRLGGDDYITKPFSIEELVLKIEVFLRRRKVVEAAPPEHFEIGAYHFDYPNLMLTHPEQERRLTQREAEVLRYLAERADRVVPRSEILKSVWGKDDYFLGRSLDVFVSRLRKYLRRDPRVKIENIHGVGFRLVTE